MREELIKLLNNCHSEIDNFKCVCCAVMNNGEKFYGVNIKNSIYRDSIYAEVSAITNAVSNGHVKKNFDSIHILANSNKFDICKQMIKEFFNDDRNVYIYELNSEKCNIIKVENL